MEVKQKVIFAFRGDPLCFIHVLLNGINLHEKKMGGEIIIEGEAITLVPVMSQTDHFLYTLYSKAKDLGIIAGACKACSAKLKMTEHVEQQGIPLLGDMAGHPSMSAYIEKGYDVITF